VEISDNQPGVSVRVPPHTASASVLLASSVLSPSASTTLPEMVPTPASAGALPSPIPSATFDAHSAPLAIMDKEPDSLGITIGEGKGKRPGDGVNCKTVNTKGTHPNSGHFD
jgi:hypothetical protein